MASVPEHDLHGFALVEETAIPELGSQARLYRHRKTGARYLSLTNTDENKVFGVCFRTPPEDSTGVAHILEHSVLCGSRKYPVKEPFVELLKGSMQTFLNAFTFPDKTCYPVASTNEQDFYNLMDVYLDAVFFPLLSPEKLAQEGWRLEAESVDGPLSYRGVVYNEMKGAYSSPDGVFAERVQQSLFPDITYGLDSGGDPKIIPTLTYEQFEAFHKRFYHPSNAWLYGYGDDPEERRLAKAAEFLDRFDAIEPSSEVPLQPRFEQPLELTERYAVTPGGDSKAMVASSWLLPETYPDDPRAGELNLLMHMLEELLIGLPASPLRKALIDSGLGDDLAGVGLESDLRQMYFSVGLKGVDPARTAEVPALARTVLEGIATEGAPARAVEAAVNSVEFDLRENNTGSFPRGLALMLRALTAWLYDKDPMQALRFESDLERIKQRLAEGEPVFENLIREHLLSNPHHTVVAMLPDEDLDTERAAEEAAALATLKVQLGEEGVRTVMAKAEALHAQQEAPDAPEDLARIPRLKVEDLDRENRVIPIKERKQHEAVVLEHELDARGVVYVDIGFDLVRAHERLRPFTNLLGRCFTEMGSTRRDFVELGLEIASRTGGVEHVTYIGSIHGSGKPSARLFLRGKAIIERAEDLAEILQEALLETQLDNRERFRQIVQEERARLEQRLTPAGHVITAKRLMARFSAAGLMDERLSGASQLAFLRELAKQVDEDWDGVLATLTALRDCLLARRGAILNVTSTAEGLGAFAKPGGALLNALPEGEGCPESPEVPAWLQAFSAKSLVLPEKEGFTIPAQVNYVGKAVDLAALGYAYHGSANVASKLLRNGYMWDRIRVQGGAYGAFSMLDRIRGVMAFCSYRDPHLAETLAVYDAVGEYLASIELDRDAMEKAIIGAINELDSYMLPDAKGFASMVRYLTGDTETLRQRMREEILSATQEDLRAFGGVVRQALTKGVVTVLGAESELQRFAAEQDAELTRLL